MKIQILIVLIFTVFCFSQINADPEVDSFEGRAIDDIAKKAKATEAKESNEILSVLAGLIRDLLKDLGDFLRKLFSVPGNESDALGVLTQLIHKVVDLLNAILPEHIDLTIISIKFIKNVIIIEIGKTDTLDPIPQLPEQPVPVPSKSYSYNVNPNAYDSYNPYPVQSSYSYSL